MKKNILYYGLMQAFLVISFNTYGRVIEPKALAMYTNFNRVLFSNEFHNNGYTNLAWRQS